jgi:urease accessory protein
MHELMTGLLHPLHGGDHLLAMLAVGFWGARYAGSARWVLPVAFVGCMALGAGLGGRLPYAETMIALSVLIIGLAVALRGRLPVAAAAALVGLFALYHGHAHMEELPAGATAGAFAAGMLIATSLLHTAGVFTALGVARVRAWLPRALGAATALAGAWLLVA